MTFVSYAQNFEDVMLWRALKHVEHGFYIDVGANDPIIDSVTHAFYEKGWHGINIEPLETHFRDLEKNRPHDVNLQCAAGARPGKIELWECDVRGWATADKRVVNQHSKNGHEGVCREVVVLPLSQVCEKYVHRPIHFLKIDVEGFERDVLEGMDFVKFRPWVVVVESTRPNSTEETHGEWEGILIAANYIFAYADGLNRYYLADEQKELLHFFTYPPNVFDDFVRIDIVQANSRAQQLESRVNQAETKAQQVESLIVQLSETQAMLDARDAILAEQKAHSQWLQNEWGAIKARLEYLAGELALSQARADGLAFQLGETQAALTVRDAALAEQQAHSQWLQNEWEAAKANINELNHSCRHWWTVADRFERELQTIYKSTFWRITWPLRKLMQFLKWLVFLPVGFLRLLIRLPRRSIRWLLTKVMKFALLHPGLSMHTRLWLSKYPKLKQHLRLFAQARGLIHAPAKCHTVSAAKLDTSPVELSSMSPLARQIYNDLKAAFEQNRRLN
ncbi:MAG: FkbM family methyltransferase [Gammaproteobacteria bacterium]